MQAHTYLPLLASLLLLPLPAQAASFDCTKAKTFAEKTICADPELSRQDETLATAFKAALATTSDKDAFKAKQMQWLTSVRNVCTDASCLKTSYQSRIAALNTPTPPNPTSPPTAGTGAYKVTAQPSLVVRKNPDIGSEKLSTVPFGGTVNVLAKTDKTGIVGGRSGTWVKIQSGSSEGYAFDAFLEKLPTTTAPATATQPAVTPPTPPEDTAKAPPPSTPPTNTSSTSSAPARTLTGTIETYDCGDNCYLTIKNEQGQQHTGLCTAPVCEPWNAIAEMPASFLHKRVQITVGTGTQIDGAGNVMGYMDAFDGITILN